MDVDVGALRRRLGLSQAQFCQSYHLPLGTLRNWEQGRNAPDPAARLLLHLIGEYPALVADAARVFADDSCKNGNK